MNLNWPYRGTRLLLASEGSSGGKVDKSSESDQRQTQATSQAGDVIGADGSINRGTSFSSSGSTITGGVSVTDQGAVNSAFGFGANVIAEVGKVFNNISTTQKEQLESGTASLGALTSLVNQNSAGGIASSNNKTILIVVGAALGLIAVIFLIRK